MRALLLIAAVRIGAESAALPAQEPRSYAATAERSRLAAADSAYNDGNRVLAQRYYAAVLEVNPRNSRAIYQLGALANDDAASAVSRFRQYVALEPRDAWGHIALAQALARTNQLDEALLEFASAQRLAPAERDVWIGRARILAHANRTDRAIEQYERWTVQHPDDAEAWRELAAQRSKAGRIAGAIVALENAQSHRATPATERRLRTLRAMTAAWTEPMSEGSRDSDGNQRVRAGLTIGSTVADGLGLDAHGSATHTGAAGSASNVYELGFGARWRPMATLRTEAQAGLAVADSVVAGGHRAQPTGELRVDWRAAGGMATVNVRASRTLIAASPLLVENAVVRNELGGRADVTVAGPLRIRALARDADITSAIDQNTRLALGGGLVLAGSVGELSATVQQISFAHHSTAGYFSPQAAKVIEAGTYAELESAKGIRLSIDAGVGAQQVTDWGLPAGSWGPAYRTWTELAVPAAVGSELRFALESYDSRIGSDVATSSMWRYLSVSVALHWALR